MKFALLALLLAPCAVPRPPAELPPSPDCRPELRLVAPAPVEPCRWMWRCGEKIVPFTSGATEPGCSTAVF